MRRLAAALPGCDVGVPVRAPWRSAASVARVRGRPTGSHSSARARRKALKSSFVLLVAFRRHGTALCPSQLYHDFQRTVKDLVLLVAKVQVAVDAGTLHYSKLHCSQIGSDREENLFSDVRTITHDRSVDMSSLGERLSAAMQVREAFAALPHADRGSRRLGNQTDDRVNPKSTTGCRDVKRVDLRACYDGAVADAVAKVRGLTDGSLR